jgi:hypothetical protein
MVMERMEIKKKEEEFEAKLEEEINSLNCERNEGMSEDEDEALFKVKEEIF